MSGEEQMKWKRIPREEPICKSELPDGFYGAMHERNPKSIEMLEIRWWGDSPVRLGVNSINAEDGLSWYDVRLDNTHICGPIQFPTEIEESER